MDILIRGHLQKPVIVVASSGIASIILHEEHTAHSTFKIPIPVTDITVCPPTRASFIGKCILETTALFWDEAPMLDKHIFEAVDRLFRFLLEIPDIPFGGKVVVFGGDFHQVLPIVPHNSQAKVEEACIKKSTSNWPFVSIVRLTRNLRISNNAKYQPFVEYLLRVGNGQEATFSDGQHHDYIKLPEHVVFQPPTDNEDNDYEKQLIRSIFPDIGSDVFDPTLFGDRAILCPLNANVDLIHQLATDMFLSDQSICYSSVDYIPDDESNATANYPLVF